MLADGTWQVSRAWRAGGAAGAGDSLSGACRRVLQLQRRPKLTSIILQDADYQPDPDMLTNVSRFARALLVRDTRTSPPTEQIKLYTPGIGTGQESLLGAVQGALGTVRFESCSSNGGA